jgi:uncharacterized protein YecE (DUF72 family)
LKKHFYIGPAGWSYPDWNGIVYPPRKSRDFDPLEFVSSYFNLIEINSTFYRLPAPETPRRWADRVAGREDFRFAVKAHQDITHSKNTGDATVMDAFKRVIDPLYEAGRLQCVLLQFPWSFKNTNESRSRLKKLIASARPFPVAIELRHGGWGRGDAIASLVQQGATVCAVDQPAIGDSLSMDSNGVGEAGAYYRMHGRNKSEWFRPGTNRDLRYNYLYTRSELAPLAESVRKAAETARQVAVVLNNHFRGQAIANAFELKSMLSGEKTAIPDHVLAAFPRLRSIALPDPNSPPREGWLFTDGSAAENDQD